MIIDTWRGCYKRGWGRELVPAAFAHPAKVSFSLAERIYAHLAEEGWIAEGATVLDPFAGIGGCAYHALKHGLHFVGVELEPKFVDLAAQNIALWNRRYAGRFMRWGTARVIQGDSRRLADVVREAGATISSHPFSDMVQHDGGPAMQQGGELHSDYGSTPGNLGNLRIDGNTFNDIIASCQENTTSTTSVSVEEKNGGKQNSALGATINESLPATSSPKRIGSRSHKHSQVKKPINGRTGIEATEDSHILNTRISVENSVENVKPADRPSASPFTTENQNMKPTVDGITQDEMSDYGVIPVTGNTTSKNLSGMPSVASLGNRPMTDAGFSAAVSSPPYAESMERVGGIDPNKSKHIGGPHSQMNNSDTRYGQTAGQLAAMRADGFDSAVSSPPFEDSQKAQDIDFFCEAQKKHRPNSGGTHPSSRGEYAPSENNLGSSSSDDFWSAARAIVEQTYAVLRPGAHAAWVVKSFIRSGALVDFPGQWRQLCEAVGFVTLHEHHALLVRDDGTQLAMDGNHKSHRTERKSFFRRMAEFNAQAVEFWRLIDSRSVKARYVRESHRALWEQYRADLIDLKEDEESAYPTRSRIMSSARASAYRDAGAPPMDIETRIDHETVYCMVKEA